MLISSAVPAKSCARLAYHNEQTRVIQDLSWRSIIRGRILIVGDMNAHSTIIVAKNRTLARLRNLLKDTS